MSTRPRKPSLLDPWRRWLEEQRESGNHNGSQIWREMVAKGFTGSETTVRDEVARWRKGGSAPVTAPARLPSASRVSRWLMPWRIIRGEESYASRFIGLMCEKEPQLKYSTATCVGLLPDLENEKQATAKQVVHSRQRKRPA